MFIACIYLSIVVLDFKLAEWIYDNILNDLLSKNEKILHEIFKSIHRMMENTIYGWVTKIKDIVFALVAGFIPLLPQVIRTPLDFLGITEYLEKSLNKYKKFEDKK